LVKAINAAFSEATPIQRRPIYKVRNIMNCLPKQLHASIRRVPCQARELNEGGKAEKLKRAITPFAVDSDVPVVLWSI
jgi:putative transposase